MKLRSTHVCLLSHNVITTCINLYLFCEICFWTLIEIFCFCTVFVIFVRWRLSVGIKRFTYLLTYLLTCLACKIKKMEVENSGNARSGIPGGPLLAYSP